MTASPESPVEPGSDYDMHSSEYATNWRGLHREIREACPVARSDKHGGFWVLSRLREVSEVARDDVRFSSRNDLGDPPGLDGIAIPPSPVRTTPIESDPPEFQTFRRLLNPYFSPAALRQWESTFDTITSACLDQVIECGSIDFVKDLGSPVPAMFTVQMLGLRLDQWQHFAQPFHDIVASMGDPEWFSEVSGQLFEVVVELVSVVAQKRFAPEDDLISALATAELDGVLIPEDRIVEMVFLLIAGGVDTTGSLIASALHWLGRHPDERARLASEPELMGPATEEFLRYFTPTQGNARTVTTDTEVAGRHLQAMDRVWISWAAANHDPTVFPDPETVLLDRFPNRHSAFGLGIHRCLGSNFARSLFSSMLRAVLDRLPDYVIDEDASRAYQSIGQVNGWDTMPATFSPGPRVGGPSPYRTALEEAPS
jgi:cytochrome P450